MITLAEGTPHHENGTAGQIKKRAWHKKHAFREFDVNNGVINNKKGSDWGFKDSTANHYDMEVLADIRCACLVSAPRPQNISIRIC